MTDNLRNRHDREEHHFGTFFSTLVGISSTLDAQVTVGMTLEEAISIIHARILVLEGEARVEATFTADAYVVGTTSFTANAVVKKTQTGSFTADAAIATATTFSFTGDAVTKKTTTGSFTADAVAKKTQSGSLTADAVIKRTSSASFTADAVVKKTISGSYTADAVIDDAGEEGFSSLYGEYILGESLLGG